MAVADHPGPIADGTTGNSGRRALVAREEHSGLYFAGFIMPVAAPERNEPVAAWRRGGATGGGRTPSTIGHRTMNAEWNAFLERTGATRAADRVAHFGRPEAELCAALAGDVCCDLSHLGLIAARGPDADPFLQGQSTCDVRQVTLEHSLPGAHCTPKGRVFACFRMFRRGDA